MNKNGIAVKEREEYIIELLKERADKGASGKEIATDLGVTPENRGLIMRGLMKIHPEIKNIGGKAKPALYVWEDHPFNEHKNAEGYPDPTVAEALTEKRNLSEPGCGEIWSTVESTGVNGKIFVLNALNGAAQCIKLYPKTTENLEIVGPDPFQVLVRSKSYIGDATHATFKPLKYCLRCEVKRDDAKLMEARKKIAQAFGIKMIWQAVETNKTDEEKEALKKQIMELKAQIDCLNEALTFAKASKEPEVPVGYVDNKTVEIAMLTEQRDIWKQVALTLLNK